jgi:hypothetical protein
LGARPRDRLGQPEPHAIPDTRAVHFWDHDRRLSAILGGPPDLLSIARAQKLGFRMKDVIWDTALVYPPGAKWSAPAASLFAPVVKWKTDLAEAVGR